MPTGMLKALGIINTVIMCFGSLYPRQIEKSTNKPALVFDLGGVLIGTDTGKAFWHLGPSNLLRYIIHSHKNPRSIRKSYYQLLDKIHGTSGNPLHLKDELGTEIPYFMYKWLCGLQRPTQLRIAIEHKIATHPEWFEYPGQQELMVNMTRLMFNPQTFIETRTLYKESFKLIKKCKKAGYPLYILSNWDEDSFMLMRKKYAKLFDLFDGILISGNIKTAKPELSIYEHCKALVNTPHVVFIDDQEENIVAARHAGLYTILCPRKSKKNMQPDIKRTWRKINNMTTLIHHTYPDIATT